MTDKYSNTDLKLLKEIYHNNFDDIQKKLKDNYPIQYLIGYVNFYGYKISVNENVLIPRFETEYLVDDTIKLINIYIKEPKIIDIGTGSGCIAISLSKKYNTIVDAIDISKAAIKVANINSINNKAKINFINKDIKKFNSKKLYNVIISNPPYVKIGSVVDKETKYEPQNALYANDNGLEYYKIILEKSINMLEKRNIISFEIGKDQGKEVVSIAKKYYPESKTILKKDLNGIDRYIYIINE